jgi:transposase
MSYSTLIMGPERRRRWSEEQKQELLAQAFGPGGNVTETSRRAEVHTSLLYRWRRASRSASTAPSFVPAMLVDPPDRAPSRADTPVIVVELAEGVRVNVTAAAPTSLVVATLKALR